MPIYHIIGNVTTSATGQVTNVEAINDVSSVFLWKVGGGRPPRARRCERLPMLTPLRHARGSTTVGPPARTPAIGR